MTSIRLRPTATAIAEEPDPARYFTGDLLTATRHAALVCASAATACP